MLYVASYASPVGPITLAGEDENIIGLWLDGQKYFAEAIKGRAGEKSVPPVLAKAKKWLDAYFAGEKPAISQLPLAPQGSDFRKTVWDILCEIPYGRCASYGEIARKAAARMNKKSLSGRAAGGATAHNPIAIIIPCHRVVGADGSLTGFAGGLDKKIKLLELEGADMSNFFIPKKGAAL